MVDTNDTWIDGWSDINQDCQLGIQETLGLMQRIVH
jgi:hypothetical protein